MFETHARFITRYHKIVILLCFLFTVIMAIGAVRMDPLSRSEELFIPQNSQAFTDLDKGHQYFLLKFRAESVLVASKKGSDVLSSNQILLRALDLHEQILKLPDFNNTCLRVGNNSNSQCFYSSVLDVFNYNRSLIQSLNTSVSMKDYLHNVYNDTTILLNSGRPAAVSFKDLLGKFDALSMFANSIRLVYYLKYAESTDDNYDSVIGAEKEIIDFCESKV